MPDARLTPVTVPGTKLHTEHKVLRCHALAIAQEGSVSPGCQSSALIHASLPICPKKDMSHHFSFRHEDSRRFAIGPESFFA